jgi:hypothetical protein
MARQNLDNSRTIIYEMTNIYQAIIFAFHNISSLNFGVILILTRCFEI